MQTIDFNIYRNKLTKLVFGFILLSLVFRYFNHALLYQLKQPTIFDTGVDFGYWFYQLLNIDEYLVRNKTIALIFDIALIATCIANIILPTQRLLKIVFSILFALYFLSFNTYLTHHSAQLIGILFITLPFWCSQEKDFKLFWQALRYFTISMLFAAFVWKVFIRHSFFNTGQAEAIVKSNMTLYLYQNPDTLFAKIIYVFLKNPLILQIGYSATICLQGAMCIGYFTKKYDSYLFWLPIIFHASTYIFVDVCFFEMWVLNFTFITESQFQKLFSKSTKTVST